MRWWEPMATTTTAAASGSAYIFVKNDNGSWSQQAKLTANDAATMDTTPSADSVSI